MTAPDPLVATRRAPGTVGRPLRVVVVGSSVAFMVTPPPETFDDEPYPGLLAEALLDRGVVAETHLHAQWHGTAKDVLRRTEPWVRDHLPDVLVVNVGFVDCQARTVPTWLYLHVVTWLPGLSGASVRYRAHVVPWLRRAVRRWQRQTAGPLPLQLSRLSPAAFRRAVTQLVRQAVRDHRAVVLLLDIDGPGPALERLMPRIGERIEAYNGLLADVVAGFGDPRVVLLTTSQLVMEDQATLLPDGIHRSAEGHRRVAQAVVEAVLASADLLGLPHGDGSLP